MNKYFKPLTKGNLIDAYNEVCTLSVWTRILRSVRIRRFRDPSNLSKVLPMHRINDISLQQKSREKHLIKTIRAWLDAYEKHNNL